MNKTLLLIICDFLLLNLIHFTAWDNIDPDSSVPGVGGTETLGSGMGDHSQDLELIKLMLAQSEQERSATTQKLDITEEDLASTTKRLDKTEKALGNVEENLGNKEAALGNAEKMNLAILSEYEQFKEAALQEANENTEENQKLTDKVAELTGIKANLENKVGDLSINLRTSDQKVSDLTGDLKAARALADREKQDASFARIEKEKALDVAAKANQQIAAARATAIAAKATAIAADSRAKEAQKAKSQVQQALAVAKTQAQGLTRAVANEQQDKEIAQQAARQLREDIAKKIPDQPINANMMATLYSQNHVDFNTRASRPLSNPDRTTKTVLIEVLEYDRSTLKNRPYVHAITHVKETPFRFADNALGWRELYGQLSREDGKTQSLHHIRFLKSDPRIIIAPVGPPDSAQVKALGVKPYKLAVRPFKFPKAFIMKKDGRKFGEVIFQMDPKNRDYVKLEKGFIRSIMGEFTPSQGDLVFSQTGELLGIMANSKYCHIIKAVTPAAAVIFGENDSNRVADKLAQMHLLVDAKPYELR